MRWEPSPGTRDAGQHRCTSPSTTTAQRAARGCVGTCVQPQPSPCACACLCKCSGYRHGSPARQPRAGTVPVCVQPPRLPLHPRKPTHRQRPSQPVATLAHMHPALSWDAAAGVSVALRGRCRAWATAALCRTQPARPLRRELRRARGCSILGRAASPRAAGGLAPHAVPSRPRAGPESSRPPSLHRTGGANTTSDDSIPHSSPAASAPSTSQLCSPPQKTLHSRELIPGHPGPSLPGCPCPRPWPVRAGQMLLQQQELKSSQRWRRAGLDGAERGQLGTKGLQGQRQGRQMRWADWGGTGDVG